MKEDVLNKYSKKIFGYCIADKNNFNKFKKDMLEIAIKIFVLLMRHMQMNMRVLRVANVLIKLS